MGLVGLKCGSIGRRTGENLPLPFPAEGCRGAHCAPTLKGKASPVVGATLAVARPCVERRVREAAPYRAAETSGRGGHMGPPLPYGFQKPSVPG